MVVVEGSQGRTCMMIPLSEDACFPASARAAPVLITSTRGTDGESALLASGIACHCGAGGSIHQLDDSRPWAMKCTMQNGSSERAVCFARKQNKSGGA